MSSITAGSNPADGTAVVTVQASQPNHRVTRFTSRTARLFSIADRRFRGLPMVLETPKGEALEEDRENLAALRGLVG